MPVRGMCSLGPKETAQPDRVFAAGDATALLRCPRHVLTEVFIFVSVEKPLPSTTAAGNNVPLCSTSHFVLPWFSFILRRRTFLLSPTCLSLLPQPVPPLLSLSRFTLAICRDSAHLPPSRFLALVIVFATVLDVVELYFSSFFARCTLHNNSRSSFLLSCSVPPQLSPSPHPSLLRRGSFGFFVSLSRTTLGFPPPHFFFLRCGGWEDVSKSRVARYGR